MDLVWARAGDHEPGDVWSPVMWSLVHRVQGATKRRVPSGPRRFDPGSAALEQTAARTSAADDLAGLEAGRADIQLPHGARCHLRPHRLDVRVPPTVGPAMGVGYVHPETGTLATHVTHGSHAEHPYR